MKLSRMRSSFVVFAAPAATLLLALHVASCGGSETSNNKPMPDAAEGTDSGENLGEAGEGSDGSQAADSTSNPGPDSTVESDANDGDASDAGQGTTSDASDAGQGTTSDASDAGQGTTSDASDGGSSVTSDGSTSDGSTGGTDGAVSSDGATPVDAAADVGVDSGVTAEAGTGGDAGTQPGSDAGDGAVACAVTVPSVDNFVSTLGTTACTAEQVCCGDTPSQFAASRCLAIDATGAAFLGVGNASPFLDGGRIAYNQAAACQCLEAVANLSCGLIQATGVDGGLAPNTLDYVQQLCLSAVQGIGGVGDPCASSYECSPGNYCTVESAVELTTGLGTCAALVGSGAACTTDNQCSYLGNGNPALYCDTATTHTCVARLVAGSACGTGGQKGGPECLSNICQLSKCVSAEVFSDPISADGTCWYFTEGDAGGYSGP